MSLPSPLPDNPKRWEGWRNYNSSNLYERLCLSFEENPSVEQIDRNCRELLVWWQKKLPLKNQPSNPITQMLRAALDEAPQYLVEAKTLLFDPRMRKQVDSELRDEARSRAMAEFEKIFAFVTVGGVLREDDEIQLYRLGAAHGLEKEKMEVIVDETLKNRGIQRSYEQAEKVAQAAATEESAVEAKPAAIPGDPFSEFRRVLSMSGLDEDEMTDDQRDALCNIGENLGLTGGQAEDLIDEYLDNAGGIQFPIPAVQGAAVQVVRPAVSDPPGRPTSRVHASVVSGPKVSAAEPKLNISPLTRAMDRQQYPDFTTFCGIQMLLIPTDYFQLGSTVPEAAPNEQPIARVGITCFYMSRYPITNAQYEQFDSAHKSKRGPWADESHPVIYVNSREAENFCLWLSNQERRRFRLPTEAEWEYAARGVDGRNFPWGENLTRGDLANFADANTAFAWRVADIDDGFAQTAPVGSYPKGASPFGIEDMAGNVFEWCLDYLAEYPARERVNPRGPVSGAKRIYRGGSWKSRIASLRASARAFNQPDYLSNDVGFRIVCEVDS